MQSWGKGEGDAVCLGFNQIRGLECDAAWRIWVARSLEQFRDVRDRVTRTTRASLTQHDMALLASADALQALTGNRQEAISSAARSVCGKDLLKVAPIEEAAVPRVVPSETENMLAAYRHAGLRSDRLPIASLRERLHKQRFIAAADLAAFSNGQIARQ